MENITLRDFIARVCDQSKQIKDLEVNSANLERKLLYLAKTEKTCPWRYLWNTLADFPAAYENISVARAHARALKILDESILKMPITQVFQLWRSLYNEPRYEGDPLMEERQLTIETDKMRDAKAFLFVDLDTTLASHRDYFWVRIAAGDENMRTRSKYVCVRLYHNPLGFSLLKNRETQTTLQKAFELWADNVWLPTLNGDYLALKREGYGDVDYSIIVLRFTGPVPEFVNNQSDSEIL